MLKAESQSTREIKLTEFQHQIGEPDNQERKWEHQLEMISKEFYERIKNFRYLYLEKSLSNRLCE